VPGFGSSSGDCSGTENMAVKSPIWRAAEAWRRVHGHRVGFPRVEVPTMNSAVERGRSAAERTHVPAPCRDVLSQHSRRSVGGTAHEQPRPPLRSRRRGDRITFQRCWGASGVGSAGNGAGRLPGQAASPSVGDPLRLC